MSYIIEIASIVGPCLSVGNIIPQIHKTYKTKNVHGISIESLYLSLLLYFIWGIYAISLGLIPLIVTDVICFLLTLYRIRLYYKYCPVNSY
jgi:uncharacterized protein with PQ loop repeat